MRQISPFSTVCSISVCPACIDHAHLAVGGDFKGLVVRAVLFGLLRHQTDVGDIAHRGDIKRAMLLAKADDLLVDAGIGAIRDHRHGVVQLAVGPYILPEARIEAAIEASTITSLGTCKLVMPLSESTIASSGPLGITGLNIGFDFSFLGGGQRLDFGIEIAQTIVGIYAQLGKEGRMFLKNILKVDRHRMAKDDRVGDLHHRRLDV